MYDSDTQDRPDLEESYAVAAASSNMRVGNDSTLRTPGDMIAAAGMNRHRTGLALLRLRSEWASSARPAAPTEAQITALASSYQVERKGEHAGKVRVVGKDGKPHFRLPARQARHEAGEWYAGELLCLLENLKSLTWVRSALLARARMGGWAPDVHAVARALLWWLDPKCTACGGAKERVIPDSGGRTNGRTCRHCRGTGVEDPPHGRAGERIAGYIRGCITAAKRELQEGVYRQNRTYKGHVQRCEGTAREGEIEFNSWAVTMQDRVHAAAEKEPDWAAEPMAALRRCATVLVDRPAEWAVTQDRGEPPMFWVVRPKAVEEAEAEVRVDPLTPVRS